MGREGLAAPFKDGENRFHRAFKVVLHIRVWKSEDAIAQPLEVRVARRIRCPMLGRIVLQSIDLDDQPASPTREVDDVIGSRPVSFARRGRTSSTLNYTQRLAAWGPLASP